MMEARIEQDQKDSSPEVVEILAILSGRIYEAESEPGCELIAATQREGYSEACYVGMLAEIGGFCRKVEFLVRDFRFGRLDSAVSLEKISTFRTSALYCNHFVITWLIENARTHPIYTYHIHMRELSRLMCLESLAPDILAAKTDVNREMSEKRLAILRMLALLVAEAKESCGGEWKLVEETLDSHGDESLASLSNEIERVVVPAATAVKKGGLSAADKAGIIEALKNVGVFRKEPLRLWFVENNETHPLFSKYLMLLEHLRLTALSIINDEVGEGKDCFEWFPGESEDLGNGIKMKRGITR